MRASIVYTVLILAFFALVIFSNQPRGPKINVHRRHGPGRRLVLRTHSPKPKNGNNVTQQQQHEQVAFDPIVADLEWRRENRAWEKEYFQEQYKRWNDTPAFETESGSHHTYQEHKSDEHAPPAQGEEHQPTPWEDEYGDPEDYLNDEEQFNITHRLEVLFPLLDTNPKDGFVSLTELQDWHVQQAENLSKQRTKREFETRDKNHDGLISLLEYLPHLSAEELVNGSTEQGQAGWWKEHFDLADANGDGGLNHTEFNDFLHPEDSHNPKLREWLRKEQISENDLDKDGKVSLAEFDHIFDVLKYYGTDLSHLHQGNDAEARKEMFLELDKNKDGFLTEDELEPVIGRLHPGESFYAKQQADYLIQQADDDKDGRLTLKEMLEHPYVFYSTAYSNDDYPEYDHDEFR